MVDIDSTVMKVCNVDYFKKCHISSISPVESMAT